MLNIYNQHVDNKDLQFNLMEKPSRERSVSISQSQSHSQTQVSPGSDRLTLSVNEPVPSGPVAMVAVALLYYHDNRGKSTLA